jgi:hypothetical protein
VMPTGETASPRVDIPPHIFLLNISVRFPY